MAQNGHSAGKDVIPGDYWSADEIRINIVSYHGAHPETMCHELVFSLNNQGSRLCRLPFEIYWSNRLCEAKFGCFQDGVEITQEGNASVKAKSKS